MATRIYKHTYSLCIICIARVFVLQLCTGRDVLLFCAYTNCVCHSATCYKMGNGIIFLQTFSENKNIDFGSFRYKMFIAWTNCPENIEKKLVWNAQNPIPYLPW